MLTDIIVYRFMNKVINPSYKEKEESLNSFIDNFDNSGEQFGKADRNTIKLFDLDGKTINIKSFKVPNIINQVAYKFFRKSKAERSFKYASKLKDLGVGTPEPIAYYTSSSLLLFKKSYYISAHLDYDLTYRHLTRELDYPNHDAILRAFTRFTYELHEKNINFLDHSPGNTLIKKEGEEYKFYLVDLNRMKFEPMTLEARIKNFARLTIYKSVIETMSDEFAKVSGEDFDYIFKKMWEETESFQHKYQRKKRIKKALKFWKK